jgi:starch-binding outer membrane protein, SusD/RagB family
MKKNYIQFGVSLLVGFTLFTSCSESFLDLTPKGESLESNYYSTPAEAFAGLVAAYSALNTETSSSYSNPLAPLNAASDDCYAGGGSSTDMSGWQAWNNYTLTPALGPQTDFWNPLFIGVAKSNTIISKVSGVPGLSSDLLKRYMAEGKFLRAHYYFDLVRLFKNVPLITTAITLSEIYTKEQASSDDVYAQIEKDLTDAISDLPATVSSSEYGRATQGAAKALLGKVYLYEKKWALSAEQLAAVNGTPGVQNATYGYQLMTNYGDIFSVNYKFNSESVFEIQHTGSQSYSWSNWGSFKSNVYVILCGIRSYTGSTYYPGWGFNPITLDLVSALKGDPRKQYTAIDMESLVSSGEATYTGGYQNTGYFIAKYAPLLANKSSSGTAELNFGNDYIEIRLADTYLMEAEALVEVNSGATTERAQPLLDAVRATVGLPSITATLENIYNERRLELATEGHRWFDLVRTGKAATVLASKGFVSGKHEILPIPLAEMTNTKLIQNPGY